MTPSEYANAINLAMRDTIERVIESHLLWAPTLRHYPMPRSGEMALTEVVLNDGRVIQVMATWDVTANTVTIETHVVRP